MPRKDRGARNAYNREWHKKNPAKHRVYQARWNKENRAKLLEYRANWAYADRHRNYETYRRYELSKRYKKFGVDQMWYDAKFSEQHGVCAVCGQPETRKHQSGITMALSIDHDHSTQKVRGLLCCACNLSLHRGRGLDWFEKAVQYLKSFDRTHDQGAGYQPPAP